MNAGLSDKPGRRADEIHVGALIPPYRIEADLCVLDARAAPLLAFRKALCDSVEALLFALMTLGDDRVVRAAYVAGHRVFDWDARMELFSYPLRCCGSAAHQKGHHPSLREARGGRSWPEAPARAACWSGQRRGHAKRVTGGVAWPGQSG